MNIKEAYAKAPGVPLAVIEDTPGLSCTTCRINCAEYVVAREIEKPTAALLAHAYNVLPEVLEELRLLYDYAHNHTPLREFEGGPPIALLRAQNIIAKASEVKV